LTLSSVFLEAGRLTINQLAMHMLHYLRPSRMSIIAAQNGQFPNCSISGLYPHRDVTAGVAGNFDASRFHHYGPVETNRPFAAASLHWPVGSGRDCTATDRQARLANATLHVSLPCAS
jgi:hypothetical protein